MIICQANFHKSSPRYTNKNDFKVPKPQKKKKRVHLV